MKSYAKFLALVGILLAGALLAACTEQQECFGINAAYRTFVASADGRIPKIAAAAQKKYRAEFDERNCSQFGMTRL